MKYLLLFVLFLASLTATFAQTTGNITGRITSVENLPLELVSISIKQLNKATLTNVDGQYQFTNVAAGNYTITIQMLGLAEKNIAVEVKAGETATLNYQLTEENIRALQEVTVVGSANKFSHKESVYIARLPLKNLENPQVYNTIPKALIQEQMALDLGSIGKNVPGAGIPMLANQGRVTFRSRGFETEPNARNGVAGQAFSSIDPANLERVEAIKGPSATLFGTSVSSSYGGLYNRVTKKPYNGFGGEVGYFGGSWNYNRLVFDINTPANADKTVLFRLNGATTFEKSFQDMGFTNSLSLAPSFSYQITDRLALLVDVELGKAEATSVVRFNPFTGSNKTQSIVDMKFPYNRLFGANDLTYQTEMMNIFAQFNYKISDKWTSQTIISRARSSINGYISALNGRTDTTLRASVIRGYTAFIANDIQQNFIGDFQIGKFRNRLVVGLDYYNNSNSFDRLTINGPTINFINPGTTYKITKQTIDGLASTGTLRAENNGDNTYAMYASDVFNVNDRLMAMLSLRVDRYFNQGVYNINTAVTTGTYNQTTLSPKLGLVYQLIKDRVSLFGNYMNGFFNRNGSDAQGNPFKPEQANQLEYGIKADVLNHKLVGTISYYDIQVKDVLRIDPKDANYSIQDGTQESKGIEIELTATPFTGFNIVAGYAYNDSKYTKADETVQGLRPALSGPPRTLNFWVSYRLSKGNLKGLGLGFGGNSGSSSFQTNTQKAKVIIPAYTIFDTTVFYDHSKFRIGFKVDNLTSEQAWSVRLTPQAPAKFTGNVTLKF
ncbi:MULTISPECIES: TonB-dependent receptor [unclassified Arcicella]|uniref:TonB-dependent receptor n=1 Tax=unclassified Arcicella TaxID=2644986 RepID=UPI0028663289|nr:MULTISPECIES: TonB-dependent receptor [unclassified Arcicella]MDR6564240.1 iron complex outermembrane receptor protein [Arcicella sp. BE51]MDR6811513.1 iron complex outermembrane receptor protein [Arcicella sp. BE140]MDR6823039.1 iron complex outermembrane receptor protein [Arcicella sp. BE139]